ncbi:hypothetical protein HD554DRAFT_2169443 [Boletus coccyginus]|nr:hypothetical protein HD554DRAFT_2169443 [Boletus coccyginus]
MNTNNPNVGPQDPIDAPVSPPSPPLQRGKACLSCRRRKMKCDGARPVCTPCLRGERVEDCEYTDGQRRPRTLTLEEDIARLRARVQELENPAGAAPPVELHAPYASAPSPGMTRSTSYPHAQARTPAPGSYQHPGSMGQGPSHEPPSGGAADPRRLELETDAHARRALSVIAPYTAELGFFLNLDRLRARGTHVLPALQSALTLWSVHITSTSGPNHAQAIEQTQTLTSNLLSQAQTQFASALTTVDAEPDPVIFLHVIQTAVLLAYYMQLTGQMIGASYYECGTWAFATVLKLHQSPHLSVGAGGSAHGNANVCAFGSAFAGSANLAPALDGIEAEERVRAFWAVYALGQWFIAVGQRPCQPLAIVGNTMTVPWPDCGRTNGAKNVIQHFLNDPNHDFVKDGPLAMHAKASVLLGEAAAVAASYVADHAVSQSPAFRARFGTLDALLHRCLNVAMTMATGRRSQAQAQALVTVHLVAFAHITLHRPFISMYKPSQKRCIEAAFGVVRVLDRMSEMGVAIAWTASCLMLHDEVLRFRVRPDPDPSRRREQGDIVAAIRKLVSLLSALSQACPSRFFAIKIEAVLSILESISA